MPRPNQPRTVLGERELAKRIALEREARELSYEALASRLTEAGCPIQGSAIYKIEKGDPPRRITVDELIALSTVFELPITDLLLPREVVVDSRLGRLFERWDRARQDAVAASKRASDEFQKLAEFVQRNHADGLEPFLKRVTDWATIEAPDDDLMADLLRAMVLARAVPVEPFQKLEDDAAQALLERQEDV